MKPSKGKVYRYIFCKLKILPNAPCKALIQKENLPPDGFKLALISKGLRRVHAIEQVVCEGFQACPDFKGIKTSFTG